MAKKSRPLSDRERAFVAEYVKDFNASEAAVRAGYSAKSKHFFGSYLLRKPSVKASIEQRQKNLEEKSVITQEYVIKGIQEVAQRCMQREPVMEMRNGERVQAMEVVQKEDGTTEVLGVWRFDSAGALKAFELLGRHLGMFKLQVQHTGKDGGPIEVTSPRELLAGKIASLSAATAAAGAPEQPV